MVYRRAIAVPFSLIPWAAFLLTLALVDPVALWVPFVALLRGVVLLAGRAMASRLRR